MSAHPKPDEPKVNNPTGLVLRYQANVRLGADFYFPEEFAQLKRLLTASLAPENHISASEGIARAIALFETVEAHYEARVNECHALLKGFISQALHWLSQAGASVEQQRHLEQARCRLVFANPAAALSQLRAVLDEFLAHRLLATTRRVGDRLQVISSLTARGLPLSRLHAFLDKTPPTTRQYRVLALMPEGALALLAEVLGAVAWHPGASTGALLVRAVQDRQRVAYLVVMDSAGEGWGEVLERHPHWDGAYLALSSKEQDALRGEIALMEHLERLVPHVRGELLLGTVGEDELTGYPKLVEILPRFALPTDGEAARRFVHRMIEGPGGGTPGPIDRGRP